MNIIKNIYYIIIYIFNNMKINKGYNDYNNYKKIFIIIFTIFFLGLFIYFIMTVSNKLIGFRVIKDYESLNKNGIPNFDELKNKYAIDKCNEQCKQEFCSEYQIQQLRYDLCKECKKDGKCYNEYKGICVPCENTYTCEQLFGCSGNRPPINPLENYCTRCWLGGNSKDNNVIDEEHNKNLFSSSKTISEESNSSSKTISEESNSSVSSYSLSSGLNSSASDYPISAYSSKYPLSSYTSSTSNF